jgi:hypothetical protein
MAEVDEHVGMVQGPEVEVACAVTGIAADNDIESQLTESTGKFRGTPFQAGRELEGNPCCPPFPELADQLRDIV